MGWLLWLVFPSNHPFFRNFHVLYAFFPFRILHVLFKISPLGTVSHRVALGNYFSLLQIVFIMAFFLSLLWVFYAFLPKRKSKEKIADLFFVSGNDVFRPPCFVVWFSRSPELSFFSHPLVFWVRSGECEEFPSVSLNGRSVRDLVATLTIWQANAISLDAP